MDMRSYNSWDLWGSTSTSNVVDIVYNVGEANPGRSRIDDLEYELASLKDKLVKQTDRIDRYNAMLYAITPFLKELVESDLIRTSSLHVPENLYSLLLDVGDKPA